MHHHLKFLTRRMPGTWLTMSCSHVQVGLFEHGRVNYVKAIGICCIGICFYVKFIRICCIGICFYVKKKGYTRQVRKWNVIQGLFLLDYIWNIVTSVVIHTAIISIMHIETSVLNMYMYIYIHYFDRCWSLMENLSLHTSYMHHNKWLYCLLNNI